MSRTTYCVDDPEIEEIFDTRTGDYFSAKEAIGCDYDRLENLRMELSESIAQKKPRYVCSTCFVGVRLNCRRRDDDKRFYFSHLHEDGNCPAITRGEHTKEQIEARKYNGVKESDAHYDMKQIVMKSLACDADFSNIVSEEIWKSQDRSSWRKPDVQAVWRGKLKVAFEIQLSTTFLSVIAERRLFYKSEGGLLCWIFKSYKTESALMTQDDIFYNNNHNLFLASEDTLKASRQSKSLMLDCRWTQPLARDGVVKEEWNSRHASFSELTKDLENQRIFLFDYDNEKARFASIANDEALKQRFYLWWAGCEGIPPADDIWDGFRSEFMRYGAHLPEYPSEIDGLINALYSARAGKAVGWRHPKFISVAHTVFSSHKKAVQPFRAALVVYKRAEQIRAEDPEGKLRRKAQAYKDSIASNEAAFLRDTKNDPLIKFLFPEVWQQLQVWDKEG